MAKALAALKAVGGQTDSILIASPFPLQRLGIFGGTFDPVHCGHLAIADTALSQLQLDQVRFLPVGLPPHRSEPLTPEHHRVAMLQIATVESQKYVVDDWELRQSAVTYTYLTLQYFKRNNDAHLYFLMGMDSLIQFLTWREWQHILELCHLVVYRRRDSSLDDVPDVLRDRLIHATNFDMSKQQNKTGDIYVLDAEEVAVSSTELREGLKHPESVEDALAPPAVLHYIKQNRLYRYA